MPARPPRRDAASERWLLLLGIVAVIVVALGTIGPWPVEVPRTTARLTMAQARASNAAVPIERSSRHPAKRYRFVGGPAAREQATECLATAALYEAGDDVRGQQAVIQVILNRTRAPGFPRTVCGVVYQGYARATGCQFSFTCDGSFRRRPVHRGWAGHAVPPAARSPGACSRRSAKRPTITPTGWSPTGATRW